MAKIYTIHGKVIGEKSRVGLTNLRVEAWDKDFNSKHYVGCTTTESDGRFRIQFNQDYFAQLYRDNIPDLFFKVYEGDTLIKTTEKEVIWNIKTPDVDINLKVPEDQLTAAKKIYTFKGTVRHTGGSPLGGVTVLLYEIYIGGRQVAGTATTNHDGSYSLQTAGSNLRPGQPPVFQLEVADEQGKILSTSSLLTQSENDFERSFVLNVDHLTVSAFARIERSIVTLLGGMDYERLQGADGQRDIAYLSLVSGQSPKEIEQFVKALVFAKEIDVAPELLYALLDQGADTLEDIFSQNDESIARTLNKAVEERLIGEENIKDLKGLSQKLNTALLRKMTADESSSSLGKLLLQIIDKKEMATVLAKRRSRQEDNDDYWDCLNSELGQDKTFAVQNILNLNAVTGQQFEMSKALLDRVGQGKSFQNVKSLARLNLAGWEELITEVSAAEEKLCVPETIAGQNEKEKKLNYATGISGFLREAYPTEAFLGDLERDQQADSPFAAVKKNLVAFLENNSDFDFRQRQAYTLDRKDAPFSFGAINAAEKQQTVDTLKKVERLFGITEDYRIIAEHIQRGDDSAYSIAQMSDDRFLRKYESIYGGKAQALLARLKAKRIVAVANELIVGLSGHMAIGTTVTTTPSLGTVADADLRTMFGSLEQAEVEESQTVYSPAAYLVDILNFLENRTDGDKEVFVELKRRRGDILNIDLTGENTFTPLPYVDLAIEQMEKLLLSRVDHSVESLQESRQTTATAKELAAGPEHLQPRAYEILQKAVFPSSLPFHLPLEEVRTYYNHLGRKRADLMRIFQPVRPPIPQGGEPEDYDWAIEYLGLSREEAGIITGQTQNTALGSFAYRNLYGFDSNNVSVPNPTDSSSTISGNWVEVLSARVDVFLQQSELSYIELLYLLNTRFINKMDTNPKISIESTDRTSPGTHILKDLGLFGLQETDLRKIAKFIRLWHKLGWQVHELDRALSALKMNLGKKEDLVTLAYAVRASEMLRLPLERVLPFWNDRIDATTYTEFNNNPPTTISSLFDRLFLNKTAVDPYLQDFQKIAQGKAQPAFNLFQETIAAALQTDLDQLLLLTETFAILPASLKATFSVLAQLYSHVTLARSLNLPIRQYITVYRLLGCNPFASPRQLCSFLDQYNQLKASGFSIRELDYLLRHQGLDEAEDILAAEELQHFQDELRSKIQGIIPGSAKLDDSADQDDAPEQDDSAEPDNTENLRENLILQIFSQRLNVSLQLAGKMLCFGEGTESLKDLVKNADFLDGNQDLSLKILLLDKIALLVNKWVLTAEELDFLLRQGDAFGFLSPAQLPVSATDTADAGGFLNLVKIIKARDALSLGAAFDLLKLTVAETPSKDAWLQKAALSLQWGTAVTDLLGDSSELTDGGILKVTFPDDFRNSDILPRLIDCTSAVKSLGIPASAIAASLGQNVSYKASSAVKNAIKTKYDEELWYTIAKQLRDPLREKQRAALVAYLVARPDSSRRELWKNTNELYEYLLIDVEMLPITMTSRIKQAISSVQLFVDRVLMNLEYTINANYVRRQLTLSAAQAEEWSQWRKLYRIWEANRKVFLYPENWLEPELRDDKSPFFQELEDALRQNDVDEENVEDAFLAYLEKLDDVARLEIKAMFHEGSSEYDADTGADVWHVLGRTYGSPHQYYYRKRVSNRWTAWEKVDAAIEGDHIIMRVWKKRLFLFWLVFTEKREKTAITMPATGENLPDACQYWEVQLVWSEFKQNKWTAKKLAKESVSTLPIKDNVENEEKFKLMKERLHLSSKEYVDSLNLALFIPEYESSIKTEQVIDRPAIKEYVKGLFSDMPEDLLISLLFKI